MQFLVREAIQDQSQLIYQDTELSDSVITVGSGSDQLLQLRGDGIERNHAVLSAKGGQLRIDCVNKKLLVVVNGESVPGADLSVGDEITFASHKINILSAPAGFDAACELYIDKELQEQAFESAFVTDLSQTFLAKRGPAYWLSLVVIIIAFAWPFSAYMLRDNDSGKSVHEGDALWISGPLLPAHQIEIGDDCSVCHLKAFQQVPDQACTGCHAGTPDHYSETVKNHLNLGYTQCQDCHKEHNEPESLIVDADSFCVDCHVDPITPAPGREQTEAVTGFDPATHPEFKLNFVLPKVITKGTGFGVDWYNKRVPHTDINNENGQKEISNLKFPHDTHLDTGKVQTGSEGRGMVCSDCHTLKTDNEHFEDITMEKHCSSCHDLSFDIAQPDRQLPHGNPASVVQTIEEHFVKIFADPNFKQSQQGSKRRRPGQKRVGITCEGTAYECGMEKATLEASAQFTQRGCITCHEVSDNGSDDLYARWQVLPVKISHDWYISGLFDHKSHLTEMGQTENQICSSCHEVQQSHVSNDVMIPGMDNCLQCHGDQAAKDKVIVNCVSCHAFHLNNQLDSINP